MGDGSGEQSGSSEPTISRDWEGALGGSVSCATMILFSRPTAQYEVHQLAYSTRRSTRCTMNGKERRGTAVLCEGRQGRGERGRDGRDSGRLRYKATGLQYHPSPCEMLESPFCRQLSVGSFSRFFLQVLGSFRRLFPCHYHMAQTVAPSLQYWRYVVQYIVLIQQCTPYFVLYSISMAHL
jgi:hypothetical protein